MELFQENILYVPSVIDPNDWLLFVLFGKNVFTVDLVLTKVDSFEGVKSADAWTSTHSSSSMAPGTSLPRFITCMKSKGCTVEI
jgi:hypothetical protein